MKKNYLLLLIVLGIISCRKAPQAEKDLAQENISWMNAYMDQLMDSNKGQLADGTTVFYCDGQQHYDLIFVRDFAYLYMWAGDRVKDADAKELLLYQLAGQRADGCMPDRVDSEGDAIYSPGGKGNPLADHALDNGSFMALSCCTYVENSGDTAFFREYEPALRKGLDFISRAENGLVFNDSQHPQCAYGFTDVVQKTGHLLFTSILYHDACRAMEALSRETGAGEPDVYAQRAKLIESHLDLLWDDEVGAFYAASEACRQHDVWGTAFALVHPELITSEQKEKALDFLIDHYDQYVHEGQLRHLLAPETWEATWGDRPAEFYQNGGVLGHSLGLVYSCDLRASP